MMEGGVFVSSSSSCDRAQHYTLINSRGPHVILKCCFNPQDCTVTVTVT